jgi:hypothetical protein
MQINHPQRLTFLWLLMSVLLSLALFGASQFLLEGAVKETLRQHLLLTLNESHFGNEQGRLNEREALESIGQQINDALQELVVSRWYSAEKSCAVRLQRVDDVVLDDRLMGREIFFGLPRNQIEREIVVGVSCSPNWLALFGASVLLGLLFITISILVPPPLSRVHRQWINYLLERGYSGEGAFEIIRQYDTSRLSLSAAQQSCLEQLHDSEQRNFSRALDVVSDPRVAALSETELDWLLLGLHHDPDNLTAALELATAGDSVMVDLNEMTLAVRGLNIPMSRTPLFYFAWYAMHRVAGDGWITNPASNRPDPVVAKELVDLMSRFDGHARAINDLEQAGLKARTLDQNRSKIKDDMVAVLGEKLASAYLFDASKHPDGVRMRYRLLLDSEHIRIIS